MITFNKLVRDGVPAEIEQEGREVVYDYYKSFDLVEAMLNKVVEEAKEVHETTEKEELVAELGDLLDVIDALTDLLEIRDDIVHARAMKEVRLGGFTQGIKLISTDDEKRISTTDNN
jgi:predicted house-cleaning noncanonical NTP pyrophosphatase (MazG superfamily)